MSKYESPMYQVILKDQNFEISEYDTFYTSSVNEQDLRGYSGFGVLFSYISGNNDAKQKMSMTIPVINTFEDKQSMEFVVPKEFYHEIPNPMNQKLSIKQYDRHFVASLRFSGLTTRTRVNKQTYRLNEWIKKHNFTINGSIQLARYNPPFSIPFLRRNEIMIPILYSNDSK